MFFLSIILKLFIFTSLILSASPYIIGVDIGSEFFKICVIKPGKPFSIVENLQSKLKTPTALSLKDDEITFGADALTKKARFPKNVFTFFTNYLGESYNSTFVNEFLKEFLIGYDIEEDSSRGTITFNIQFNKKQEKIRIEEVYGLLFDHIKFISEKYAGIQITDVFVTIPSFFNYKQRQALTQAIELSKLKLNGFVSENLAAAVQFQLKKVYEKEQFFIFYNIGGSFTQVSLVSYKTLYEEKNNNTVDIGNEVNVIGEAWDRTLGGHSFDKNLINLLMSKFDALPQRENKPSIKGNAKIFEKFIPHAVKYKEILSANKEAHVAILNVDSSMNFEGMITRDEFHEVNQELFDRVYTPIETLLANADLTIENITQIELIGGTIRIPKIQEILKEKLGEYSHILGTHMNGDDSMAFGTAYIAANATKNFKGSRKTFMINSANAEYTMYFNNYNFSEDAIYCDKDDNITLTCEHLLMKNKTIIPFKTPYGQSKKVTFKHDGDISIKITERMKYENEEKEIMSYTVKGIRNLTLDLIAQNLIQTPKLILKFDYSKTGTLSLRASAEYEEDLWLGLFVDENGNEEIKYTRNYSEKLPQEEIDSIEKKLNESVVLSDNEYIKLLNTLENITKNENITSNEINVNNNVTNDNSTINVNKTELIENITRSISETEKRRLIKRKNIGHKKTETQTRYLTTEITYTNPKPLNDEEMKQSKLKMKHLVEVDLNRTKIIEKKNSIESILYNRKDWLESDSSRNFFNESEYEITKLYLENKSNWYDEDGYIADLPTLENELKNLSSYFYIFDKRQKIYIDRNEALIKFYTEYNNTHNQAIKLIERDPWRFEHYNTTFRKDVSSVLEWLNTSLIEQDSKKLYEEPTLTADAIKAKISILKRAMSQLRNVKKPIPPEKLDLNKLSQEGGLNLEDMMKNGNITKEQWEAMNNYMKNKTEGNETVVEDKEEKQKEKEVEEQERKTDL